MTSEELFQWQLFIVFEVFEFQFVTGCLCSAPKLNLMADA